MDFPLPYNEIPSKNTILFKSETLLSVVELLTRRLVLLSAPLEEATTEVNGCTQIFELGGDDRVDFLTFFVRYIINGLFSSNCLFGVEN